MELTSARPADGIEEVLDRFGNQLYRICLITLKNEADAEDAIQETLIKYLSKAPKFESAEHQKAWLLRVAVNQCRDMLRKRRQAVDIETILIPDALPQEREALDALMTVPEKFRFVLTLHYVEGYSVNEISKIIGRTPSAVKMRLQKGRGLLAEALGKE